MDKKRVNRKWTSVVKITVLLLCSGFLFFICYVLVQNRNLKEMTLRQKILRTTYPFLVSFSSHKKIIESPNQIPPPVSFYDLEAITISGERISFDQFKGKKVLIVNTASNCGYTPQYDELQQLYLEGKGQLYILAFPSNEYKQQEKGSEESIASFCQKNYDIRFPVMKKAITKKTNEQHPVYQWLTNPAMNGWNEKTPAWNFSKYLINEKGILTHYFDPAVSPLEKRFQECLNK